LGAFGQLCLRGHVLSACFVLTAGVQEWLLKGAFFSAGLFVIWCSSVYSLVSWP